MFFQMKFKFSKKFQTVYDFTENFCFSSTTLYPETVTAAMLTLPKNKRST